MTPFLTRFLCAFEGIIDAMVQLLKLTFKLVNDIKAMIQAFAVQTIPLSSEEQRVARIDLSKRRWKNRYPTEQQSVRKEVPARQVKIFKHAEAISEWSQGRIW